MFDGINLKTFLNTHQEWHALVIGFFEVLCPWPPRCHLTRATMGELRKEFHYYVTGRGLGFVAFVYLCLGIAKFVKEILL